MKKIEYYCDCCNKQVKDSKDLDNITIYNSFKWAKGNEYPYTTHEVCNICKDELDSTLSKKFHEIQFKNKMSNTVQTHKI